MNSRVKFLIEFFFLAFVMKIIGEFVHEVMGHGFFVLLFGGKIVRVYISLLWPYELSNIVWNGNFEAWQMPWIDGGGILVCLIVSCALQISLLLRIVRDWRFSSPLFWLSFWTFLNPTGYLIMGGIRPFGDVAALIREGALTQETSIVMGLIMFLAAFFSLSKIFRDILLNIGIVRRIRDLRISLSLFWLLIPLTTAMTLIGLKQPLFYLPVSFIPIILVLIAPSIPPVNLPSNEKR
jgi:hypothetical protein